MAGSPQEVADRWAQRLAASAEKIKSGVQGVTTSPTQSAANAADFWQQRMQDPQTKAKYVNSLNKVSLSQWQQAMLGKGVNRIASGANDAKPKVASFLQQFLPYVEQGAAMVRAMPKGGIEDAVNRAAAMIRHNANFRRA